MFGLSFVEGLMLLMSAAALCWAIKEVYEMITIRKMWERLLHNPEYTGEVLSNALLGFMKSVSQNPHKRDAFLEFCRIVGASMLGQAQQVTGQLKKKHKEWLGLADALVNFGQHYFGLDLGKAKAAKDVATSAKNVRQGKDPASRTETVEYDYGLASTE